MHDLVVRRPGNDRVVLFQDGALVELLEQAGIDVAVCSLGDRAATLRKESGLGQKFAAVGGMVSLIRKVAAQAHDFDVIYANTAKAFVVAAIAGKHPCNGRNIVSPPWTINLFGSALPASVPSRRVPG